MNKQETIYRKIKAETATRSAPIVRSAVDEEKRTVEIAFSSEEPVDRWYGQEILDHSPDSVDLTRMNSGGAILVDHDWRDHVGVVESIRIDDDKKGRLVARFGSSQRAQEIFQDISDGIRTNVSVGYKVKSATLEETGSDIDDVYRINSWEPMEVSVVSVPADIKTGVGRSAVVNNPPEEKTMDPVKTATDEPKTPTITVEDVRNQELARIKALREAGKIFKQEDFAEQHITRGTDLEGFRQKLLDKIAEENANKSHLTELGLTKKETRSYSFFKAIKAHRDNDWSDAGFELECSREITERLDRTPRGFFVPFEVQNDFSQRELNVATTADDIVGTDHLGGSFIDRLRAESVIGRLNARFMQGLVGFVDIPRLDTGGTFYWLAEGADSTLSDPTFSTVTLSPKTLAGAVAMTRRLLKQSDPSVEAIIRNDLVRGAAIEIDIKAFQGDGLSDTPLGVLNQTGVATQAVTNFATTPLQPTWGEVVGFESQLAEVEAAFGSLHYVTNPSDYGTLKTTPKDAGSGLFLLEGGEMNGYPVTRTTSIGSDMILFGNFSDLIVGGWGVLDVRTDTATNAASDGLIVRVFQDIDIAVRHGASFCKAAATSS